MHIELTEMLRCPEPHREEYLVLSTGEMSGRMVRRGLVGCPVCHREYAIVDGVVHFVERGTGTQSREGGGERPTPAPALPPPDPQALQALLDLSGPGGFVVLLGSAVRSAEGLTGVLSGIHLVGINPPPQIAERPALSLLRADAVVPLRARVVRGAVVGSELAVPAWLAEAKRVLLPGRRLVVEWEGVAVPGVAQLAVGQGLWVGENQ